MQRSQSNWMTKSGGADALNISLIDFKTNYPLLSSIFDYTDFEVINCNDYRNITPKSLVSTFVDDYILERYWNNPTRYVAHFNGAKMVMSPDFSLLLGMPIPMQIWNVYRNRLVGYVWQSYGINVIPTISWSDESSFNFCFEGIIKNSAVAVSNIGCRNDKNKSYFDKGFNKMIEILNPSCIFFQCNKKYRGFYNQENIVFLDSFWDKKRINNGR